MLIFSHVWLSNFQLTCETTPAIEVGSFLVYVSVGGDEPVTYGGFTYTNDLTPSKWIVTQFVIVVKSVIITSQTL